MASRHNKLQNKNKNKKEIENKIENKIMLICFGEKVGKNCLRRENTHGK